MKTAPWATFYWKMVLGCYSSNTVEQFAAAATSSGCKTPDVQRLSALGAHGHLPGNIHKALVRQFSKGLLTPEPYIVNVPLKVRRRTRVSVVTQPLHILLPHEWIGALAEADISADVLGLQRVQGFCNSHDGRDPKFYLNDLGNDKVPLLVHGDGGQFQKRDSILVLSMRSILATENVKTSQLLLAAVPNKCRTKGVLGDTWEQVWTVVAWSFTALFEGKHPRTDHLGNPWPPGSQRALRAGTSMPKAVIYALGGDLEYLMNEYGLRHHAHANPCSWCPCNWTDLPWNDLKENSAALLNRHTAARNRGNPPTQHRCMTCPGVVAETFA